MTLATTPQPFRIQLGTLAQSTVSLDVRLEVEAVLTGIERGATLAPRLS